MSLAKAAEKAKAAAKTAAKTSKKVVRKVVKKATKPAAKPATEVQEQKAVAAPAAVEKPKDKNTAFAMELKADPEMRAITINNERAISFPMKVLEKHFLTLNKAKIENDAQFADVLIRMDLSGKWSELGCANAHDYFVVRHKISRSTVDTHRKAVRLLHALKSEMNLQKAYDVYSPSMLALLYSWGLGAGLTRKELDSELHNCERADNPRSLDDFRNYLKNKYAARKAKVDKDANEGLPEAEVPVKIESFMVPAYQASLIREAQNVAVKQTGRSQTNLGEAIAIACSDYVSNYGVNYTSLKTALNAITHRYNVLPIVLPNPEITDVQNKDLKDVPLLQAFEHNGMYILHTTRAKAAKALGVKTDDVTVIRLNVQAALRDLYGWEEQMAKTDIPKPLSEMSDDDIVEAIGRYKHELGVERGDWSAMAAGKNSREQLTMLLKMKSARDAGEQASSETAETPAVDVTVEKTEPATEDADEPAEVKAMMATDDALAAQEQSDEEKEVVKPVTVKVSDTPAAPVKKRVVLRKKA